MGITMKDIDESAYYDEAVQCMEKNNAGEYEIIRNSAGVRGADSRLYYRTYIPASLQQVDEQQFQTDEWGHKLKFIYREIGIMQSSEAAVMILSASSAVPAHSTS